MTERELLPTTRAAMADELADMLRVVLARWTPGNPARLGHVRALLAQYDALPDAEQLAADRALVAQRTGQILVEREIVNGVEIPF
jgi:hypothetical protein